jgi:hypothetical protein
MGINNPKIKIDHKFGDTLDNRKQSLRLCTNDENRKNSKLNKNNTSGYKGVIWYKPYKKWRAEITIFYISKHLGYFKNKICAACAYNNAASKYFGEFARLNEVNNGR